MSDIIIKMKDGTERKFLHEGRPGGSFTKELRYEPGFVVVEDEYDNETVIPTVDIAEINVYPHRGGY